MINMSWVIKTAAAAISLLLIWKVAKFFWKYRRNRKMLSRIPAPPGGLLFGNIHFILQGSHKMFNTLRELALQYYPIYRLSVFYVSIVSILDPRDIEIVLSSTRHLSKSKIYTFLHRWLGTGLLTSTGEKWHKRRKILTPAFHFSILQQFLTVFNEETEKLVQDLSNETGNVINVVPPITHFTLQSIGETAMGLNEVEKSAQIAYKAAIHDVGEIFMKRLQTPWFRVQQVYDFSSLAQEEMKTVQILHDFSNSVIQKKQEVLLEKSRHVGDVLGNYSKKRRLAMLDLLLEAKNDRNEIDDEGIREEVDTFMFEGHDTTSMAISFILLCLANHPDYQDRVYKEILEVLGPEKLPDSEDLQQLKYMEMVIKESLRMFPSVPLISRYAGEDFTTKTGFGVPKGTIVHIHIFDIHRNPNLYPDPLRFDPDRFSPENNRERHPFAYIPFSAGPRNCIGQRFAMMELKTVLCGVLRRFSLEKIDGIHDIVFKPDLVLRPVNEVRIKLLSRLCDG